MALWRAVALERLPEFKKTIETARNLMSLWIELSLAFDKAYQRQPRNESLIERIYSFADWCESAPRQPDAEHDPSTAVVVCFYEHIPTCSPAREDMPRWFTFSEVAQDKRLFAYLIGDTAYSELLAHMSKNRSQYKKRPFAKHPSQNLS